MAISMTGIIEICIVSRRKDADFSNNHILLQFYENKKFVGRSICFAGGLCLQGGGAGGGAGT